jgi:hypothetical protein
MISLIGDIFIVAGTWAYMGQNPKISAMPLAVYEKMQMLHPMTVLLLPLGIVLALFGRISYIVSAQHKVIAFFVALLRFGRLPLIEGIASSIAFAYLYQQLTPTEMSGMLVWIAITLTIGCALLWLAHKVNSYGYRRS